MSDTLLPSLGSPLSESPARFGGSAFVGTKRPLNTKLLQTSPPGLQLFNNLRASATFKPAARKSSNSTVSTKLSTSRKQYSPRGSIRVWATLSGRLKSLNKATISARCAICRYAHLNVSGFEAPNESRWDTKMST